VFLDQGNSRLLRKVLEDLLPWPVVWTSSGCFIVADPRSTTSWMAGATALGSRAQHRPLGAGEG